MKKLSAALFSIAILGTSVFADGGVVLFDGGVVLFDGGVVLRVASALTGGVVL